VRLPEPPTALFAYHDALAALVLKYLGDIGIPVPERMAVVGFDNLDLAAYITPHLTTVDHHLGDQCEQAVGMLLKRIHGDQLPPQHRVLAPCVIVRRSCGVPPQDRVCVQAQSTYVAAASRQQERSISE
jgi:LacI family transcriptional regulator